jgi:flagellar biosynthesis protein
MKNRSESRQSAVALRYGEADAAPVVTAKGRGLVAEEIVRRAREAGLFVHESPELVGLLMQVDLDERIPPALYVAIAELLAWVHRIERGLPARAGLVPSGPAAPSPGPAP